ncbi:hypothetical protein [Pontiella sulfatireligans]|uniref:(Na+)-NQR maturation NqrM n=1 Tax=Pontiella sulfatireligans TaxID=2750658 RepID=A0A6C2UM92_9BACT|nr:hypothetical protein [Pontiella sulfatireligans]VGO21248.1 hypothetical protein SCARR_03320 [Pontiella sulfatireligans]
MTSFITQFIVALIAVGIPLSILGLINALRKKQPGCSGSHDCVVYKGEKVQCPSCDLREFKAQLAAAQQQQQD